MRLSPRGHRTGRSLALGALALGGASVALAGCAVASAPKTGAQSHLVGTTSSPTPEQRAAADANAIFSAFVVPPGAQRLASAPSLGGGVLKSTSHPGTPDLIDKAGWWLAPGTAKHLLAWETAHLPHRFDTDGSSRSSGPGVPTVLGDTFFLPAVSHVLDSRELLVQVAADGKKTAIRVDAQVTWTPARPAGERVPTAAKAVTLSEDLGLNPGKAKTPKPVTITDPAKVSRLVALVNALPLTQPGEFGCPSGFGDNLTLTFRAAPGAPALAVATDELSGCPAVSFTLGGKSQPDLVAVSGPRILTLAGLPWKIPSRSSGPGSLGV